MEGPVAVHDFSNMCRMCLAKGSHNLFFSLGREPIRGLFIRSTHLYVHSGDGLPQRICKECLERCKYWLEFRDKAEENEKYLQSLVVDNKPVRTKAQPLVKLEKEKKKTNTIEEYIVESDDQMDDVIEEEAGHDTDIEEASDFGESKNKIEEQEQEQDETNVEIENWESILHDATVYPIDPHAPVVESAEPSVTINMQGNDPVILCPIPNCVQEFIGFKDFEGHCLTHVDKKNIICPMCDLRYGRTENFKNHMYIHANQKFGCSECDKLFTRPKTLSDHMRDAHAKYSRKNLEAIRHEEEEMLQNQQQVPGFSRAPVGSKSAAGAVAKRKQPKRKLRAPLGNRNDDEYDDDDDDEHEDTGDEEEGYDVTELPDDALVSCPVCQLGCTSYKSFEEHILTHVSRISKTCPICDKKFLRIENLKCHLYLHTDAKFTCSLCHRQFVNPKTLAAHLRETHQTLMSDVKRNQDDDDHRPKKESPEIAVAGSNCSYCGKYFENKKSMREHLKYHTADTRYPCPMCPMLFRLKSSQRIHIKQVHKRPSKYPVTCPVCEQVIPSKSQLGQHVLTEHPDLEHLCKECGEVCKTQQGLRFHRISKHTEESKAKNESYVCEECGKRFRGPTRYKEHMMTHDMPCTCDICGLIFKSSSNLGQHVESAHGGYKEEEV